MNKYKSVLISEETHSALKEIYYEIKSKNMDATISQLIIEYKQKKGL